MKGRDDLLVIARVGTMFKQFLASVALAASLPLALAQSPAPANPTVRLRATIEKIDATSLTVRERSGEVITLVRPAAMDVSEVFPLALADIKPGSYIGTAAMVAERGEIKIGVTLYSIARYLLHG